MSAIDPAVLLEEAIPVPFPEIERELAKQLKRLQGPGEDPVQRARMSNLIIFCDSREQGIGIAAIAPDFISVHPCRLILLVHDQESAPESLAASVLVREKRTAHAAVVSEQVTIVAGAARLDRLPFAVRRLLIGDLPTNLVWASSTPPPLAGSLINEMAEYAQQVIYDSRGWAEPAKGVAATANWLARTEMIDPDTGAWRVASDLNWRRLKFWRRMISQSVAPAAVPGFLDGIHEVVVEHGPHAVVQAWELVSWLACRLHWKVQAGSVQPNVEIDWQVMSGQGRLIVKLRRLPDGPSEVRTVHLASTMNGRLVAMKIAPDDAGHLVATLDDPNFAPRSMAIQDMTTADLVGRQLSDRERDPIFRESMDVAQIFAKSVLR